MKIIKSFLPLIIIVFSITSCKKEKNTNGNLNPLKVKTYTESINYGGGNSETITFNIEYDSNDRMISMTSASSPGDRFEYKYSSGSFTMDIYNSNELTIHEIFFLNSKSLIDSTLQYDKSKDTTTEKYIYNNANQLITQKIYDYSKATGAILDNTTHFNYDDAGNMIKETDDYSVTSYEYYPDLKNYLFTFGLPSDRSTRNLVKKKILTSGGYSVTSNYVYTFDTNNRISTEIMTLDSGEIATRTYTYYD